jgi:hypothetical protein
LDQMQHERNHQRDSGDKKFRCDPGKHK